MPSSYTPSLRLTLPVTGELSGQWGTTVNNGITELLDSAVAGTATISTWGGAGVAYTLTSANGAADEARKMFIVATGAPGEAKNVICPAVSKLYVFRNNTTGGFALTLKTSGGTGIAVAAGQAKLLYCDGTNVVEAVNALGPLANLTASQAVFTDASKNLVSNAITGTGNVVMSASPTLTGTVGAASLTLSSLTSGRVTYAGASGLLQDSANLTFNGTDLTVSGAVNAGSVNATTLDLTNLEVTNIKAKDGTASASIADSTGVMTIASSVLTTTDINGGSIDGTAIGASSASTGAFTTLSASGNMTLSGGTANGVLYLNGSKVATSGSALTFDGTTLGVTSGSSGTPALKLYGAAVSQGQLQFSSTAGYGIAGGPDYTGLVYNVGSAVYQHIWQINSSEQMRLTSTGLGIGTSSPYSKLHVKQGADGTPTQGFTIEAAANDNRLVQYYHATNNEWVISATYGSTGAFKPFTWWTSDIKRMTLDASGNLGLGVTPSAWGALGYVTALQLNNRGAYVAGTSNTYSSAPFLYVGNNAFYDDVAGVFKYVTTNTSAQYLQSASSHIWFTAPSGTAGNAITFTQAMTLDASGNLGIGATSPISYARLTLEKSGGDSAIALVKTGGAQTAYLAADGINAWIGSSFGSTGKKFFVSLTAPDSAATLDSSGNLGIGTNSPAYKLDVNGTGGVRFTGTNSNRPVTIDTDVMIKGETGSWAVTHGFIGSSGTNRGGFGALGTADAINYYWIGSAYNSNQFVLNSDGNLGIGTSSPSSAYSGAARVAMVEATGTTAASLRVSSANASAELYSAGSVTEWGLYSASNSPFSIWTNGNKNLTLDASGNLGLGVTPSAWGGTYKGFQIGQGGLMSRTGGSDVYLLGNNYYDGTNFRYINTSFASRYQQDSGVHAWYTAPSGTAGDPISFTQAMTLDASGNLGLGVTPSAWGATYKALQLSTGGSINGRTNTENQVAVSANAYHNGTAWTYIGSTFATQYQQASGVHYWYTAPSGTAGNPISFTQAMTLFASGALHLGGTADPGSIGLLRATGANGWSQMGDGAFQANRSDGMYLIQQANGPMVFDTNGSERARITSGGDLLVGTTSSGIGTARAIVYNDATNFAAIFANVNTTSASTSVSRIYHVGASGGTYAVMLELLNGSGSVVGTITSNGTATTYNTSSDYRLKDNPQPLTNSGAFIDALQPKTWEWKTDGSRGVGFIAHEAQAVSPSSVVGEKDAVDADGNPVMQAMEYGSAEFIANIIAELQSLRARVAALESN